MEKVHRCITFNPKTWLKPYIGMNTDLEKKMTLRKTFSSWWVSQFWKTIENVWKHRYIKPVTTERRSNYLVSESNYHTKKFLTENLLTIEMRQAPILMNELFVYVFINIPSDKNCNVIGLVWLCKTKVWQKSKTFFIWIQTVSLST